MKRPKTSKKLVALLLCLMLLPGIGLNTASAEEPATDSEGTTYVIDNYYYEPSCNETVYEFDSSLNYIVAKLTHNKGFAVWTKDALNDQQKQAFINAYNKACKTEKHKNMILNTKKDTINFYSGSMDAYDNGFRVYDSTEGKQILQFEHESVWATMVYGNFSTQELASHADITIFKDGPESASPGEEIEYNFTVKNTGNVTLTDIVVTDTILGEGWSHDVGTLNPGGSTSFTANYVIPGTASDTITNIATVTGNYGDNPVTDNDSYDVDIIIEEEDNPVITIDKTGPESASPGEEIEYNFTVKNTGNVTLTDIVVTDPLFGATWKYPIGTLAAGASTNFTAEYTIPGTASRTINNTVMALVYYDGKAYWASASHDVDIIIEEEEDKPALTIDKTGPTSARRGNTITYNFTVTNSGNVTLTNIVVTDPLFPDWRPTIAFLDPSDSVDFQYNYTIPADADGTINNTVTATVYYNDKAYSNSDSHKVNIITGGGGDTTPGGGGGGGTVVVPTEEPTTEPEVIISPEKPTVPPVEPTTPPEKPGEVIVSPEKPTTEPEVIIPTEEPKAQPEEEKLPYTGADANVLLGLLMGVILAGSGLFLLKKSRVK